jgi:hypothetical protein
LVPGGRSIEHSVIAGWVAIAADSESPAKMIFLRFVPIEEATLSIGRASEYASSTTLVERPAHLFTKLSLRPIALFASIGN